MKPSFRRWPLVFSLFSMTVYGLGVLWRWFFITSWHDPRKYVYSDMEMYVSLAKRTSPADYVIKSYDVTHPPGNTWIMAYFLRHDPTLQLHVYFNFLIAALLPLAVAALAYGAFGRRAAEWSVIVASLNFEFVDFGGYFLAEIHMALVSTAAIAFYLLAMKVADGPPAIRRTVGLVVFALSGGIFFSFAMTLKMVAMPAIGGFCILHFLFTRGPKHALRAVIFAIYMIAATPLTGFVAARCTKANDGHFCSGSNKSAADFLLGHYGRIGGIEWHPPGGGVIGFGSPAAVQRGYTQREVVAFAITDQPKNNAAAWGWALSHPGQSLVLGVEHVFDAFGGSYPWPSNCVGIWPQVYAGHYAFLFLMIIPTVMLLVDILRKRGVMGLMRSMELVVFSPIVGLMLALFLATGEARYRMPWDAVFIVLGVEFWRRARLRFRTPLSSTTIDGAPPPREKAQA